MGTRFYFPASSGAVVTPTIDSAWNDYEDYVSRRLSQTKGTSTLAFGSSIDWTSGSKALDRQYVSDKMQSGIEFSTSVTVKGQLVIKESGSNDNVGQIMLGIRVVSQDGGTVRRTLLAVAGYRAYNETDTTGINRMIADGDALAPSSSYTTVEGDRLCIELGYTDNAGTSIAAQGMWGENGTDLPESESGTSGVGWIEFSNTITFVTEATARNTIMLMGL